MYPDWYRELWAGWEDWAWGGGLLRPTSCAAGGFVKPPPEGAPGSLCIIGFPLINIIAYEKDGINLEN